MPTIKTPTITVKSPTEVLVDGSHYGVVADTIVNNPKLASDIQRALEEWQAGVDAEKAATKKALDDLKSFSTNLVSQAKAALSDDKLSNQERKSILAAIVAEAEKPALDRERDALTAQRAALDAKIRALS